MMSDSRATQALDRLIARALALQPDNVFATTFDPDWRSVCEIDVTADGDRVRWRPARQEQPVDFRGLENALEIPVHQSIKDYYGRYWAGGIETTSEEGHVSLIQLWNPDDFDRLIANLIGHSLAKRQSDDPFTVFFATTEPNSELFLSIDNLSGRILLEEPGKPPLRDVEQDIGTFLDRLTPLDTPPSMY